ncbi:MAG: N-acetylmuramoyl-L-alanine amidase, partial [Clostridia bacterium]|nr:N-acetylmuramoyl-L-alanine amidase [Clostridia bacterium]
MRVGINCGHTVSGTVGCGAVKYIDESVETRAVGKRLMTLLRRNGHTVYDCTNDYAPTVSSNLSQIVTMANNQPLDLFVSVH